MLFCRGCVHALKLSPNLRKQSLEQRKAALNGDIKTVKALEVKKLDILLAMVNDPEEIDEQEEEMI